MHMIKLSITETKIEPGQAKALNVEWVLPRKLLHLNTKWVNPYGIAYAKGGVFLDDDRTIWRSAGFRYPVHLTGKDKNGYYVRGYAGHIDCKQVDGEYEGRLGAGIDLGLCVASVPRRISSLVSGIGAEKTRRPKWSCCGLETEPQTTNLIYFKYRFIDKIINFINNCTQ